MTYKQSISPVQRRDLADWFKTANQYYPGYVKQEVFRVKIKEVVSEAKMKSDNATAIVMNRGLEMRAAPNRGPFITANKGNIPKLTSLPDKRPSFNATPDDRPDPSWSTSFRTEILKGVESKEWRPINALSTLSKDLRKKAGQHFYAAAAEPVSQIGGKKIAEKGVKYAQQTARYVNDAGKISPKLGKWADRAVTTYEVKPEKFSNPVVNANATEWGIGKTLDAVKPKGFEVTINNAENRAFLKKYTKMPESVSSVILWSMDFASDFIPVAVITKSVESFLANSYLSFMYWSEARAVEETEKHFNKMWAEFTKKLKNYIKKDIDSLSDQDLNNLYSYLETK